MDGDEARVHHTSCRYLSLTNYFPAATVEFWAWKQVSQIFFGWYVYIYIIHYIASKWPTIFVWLSDLGLFDLYAKTLSFHLWWVAWHPKVLTKPPLPHKLCWKSNFFLQDLLHVYPQPFLRTALTCHDMSLEMDWRVPTCLYSSPLIFRHTRFYHWTLALNKVVGSITKHQKHAPNVQTLPLLSSENLMYRKTMV